MANRLEIEDFVAGSSMRADEKDQLMRHTFEEERLIMLTLELLTGI